MFAVYSQPIETKGPTAAYLPQPAQINLPKTLYFDFFVFASAVSEAGVSP